MKERILKELGYVFDYEEPIGFFSFTVSESKSGRKIPTVTIFCERITEQQRGEVSSALFNLFDAIKPVFEDKGK